MADYTEFIPESDLEGVEALLLDLGGVLYDIDPSRAERAFRALAGPDGVSPPAELFQGLETGELSTLEFYEGMREVLDTGATDAELTAAWNALLLGPHPGRAAQLEALAQRFPLYLLSNTNRIHHQHFMPQCTALFRPFRQLFFSFDSGFRKPDPDIFLWVCRNAGIRPEHTLFVDDSAEHIESAARLGFRTRHHS